MVESIKELREICQDSKEYTPRKITAWTEKNINRRISIYFTRIFIKTGLSANQITLMNLFIVLIAGLFLTFGNPKYWIIGVLFLYLQLIFDRVDGEVARYNKSASAAGDYWDGMCDLCIGPYRVACMTFGIYNVLQDIIVFIFGFLAAISMSLSWLSKLYTYESGLPLPSETVEINDEDTSKKSKAGILLECGRFIFNNDLIFIITILIAAIIDIFIPVITISYIPFVGSFGINARFILLIVFGMAVSTTLIFRIYRTVRGGVQQSF